MKIEMVLPKTMIENTLLFGRNMYKLTLDRTLDRHIHEHFSDTYTDTWHTHTRTLGAGSPTAL